MRETSSKRWGSDFQVKARSMVVAIRASAAGGVGVQNGRVRRRKVGMFGAYLAAAKTKRIPFFKNKAEKLLKTKDRPEKQTGTNRKTKRRSC
ncbi:MAG TPA: hypothetical protein VFZ27_05350 [Terriglobia bacterium]|nr:hypothetical protein [Terriglobia bacterium]